MHSGSGESVCAEPGGSIYAGGGAGPCSESSGNRYAGLGSGFYSSPFGRSPSGPLSVCKSGVAEPFAPFNRSPISKQLASEGRASRLS